MTLTLPIEGRRGSRTRAARFPVTRFTKLDAMLAFILLGPLAILQVAGRTPSLYWIDVAIVVFSTVAFAKTCAQPAGFAFRVPPAILWAIVYVLICAASLLLTEDPLLGIATLKLRIMPIAAFLLASRRVRTQPDIEHFFNSLIWFGFALAAIALYNWYRFSSGALVLSDELGPKDMLQLAFGRSNYLASMFAILIPTMIVFAREKRRLASRLSYTGALLLVSVALVFTQSRGAMISLALGLTSWALFGFARAPSPRKVIKSLFLLTSGLVAGVLIWHKMPDDIRVGLDTGFSLFWSDASRGNYGGGRTELWVAAIKGAWQAHLFGIGLGNQAIWYARAGMTPSAHSLYLETLLETGIVGLVALLGILYAFGIILWRIWASCPVRDHRMVGALLGTFVTSLINVSQEPSFWAPQYSCLFWMIMGVAYSWRRIQLAGVSSLTAAGM